MSSWAENKTASQLMSLTMRLKDKLHPQWTRRTERHKHTLTTQPPVLKPHDQHQPGCVLLVRQRAVISSLQYFKALVDRLGVDRSGVNRLVLDPSVVGGLLAGASGGVLEAVHTLVQLEPHLLNSKTMSTCLTHLYQSVAQLIIWSDLVILQGVSHEDSESTTSLTRVIRAVLDGVKDLVRLALERQEDSTTLSPVHSQPYMGQMQGLDERETSDWTVTVDEDDGETEERVEKSREEVMLLPPPKPHMPLDIPRMSVQQGHSPPALPPKKRPSSAGPTPCRVAIVAPMRRDPEVDTRGQHEENKCWTRCSSSADSAAEHKHCDEHTTGVFVSTDSEADPDYDFLHTDLSFSYDCLPPLPLHSSLPPALPEKKHGTEESRRMSNSQDASSMVTQDSTHCGDVIDPDEPPPPLPEKKRHIHQYLQFCSSYSAPSAAMFYQTPSTFRQQVVETTHQLMHTHLDTHMLTDSDSTPSAEHSAAPALPPKKKQQDQQDSAKDDEKHKVNLKDCFQAEKGGCHGSSKEPEELLLTNTQEILQRITMKTETEEGPDVKAASPDILLVFATETDSTNEHILYCEAFLSTYRSFISPQDVISKLQYRYSHLRDGHEAAELKAAERTFHLLVRVVDELCVIEMHSDLLLLLTDMVFSLLTGGELELAQMLRSHILSKMEHKWQSGSTLSLRPLTARGVAARPGCLLDFRSQDLAEQMTLMDSDLFYKIELPEVLLWSKEQNEEKSPNLTEFTQHFNNVSFWVRSIIILQDKPQDREKLLLKFMKIMKHLRKLNNFNSYLSILSALDSAPLRRLDWQRSSAEALEELGSLIDSSSSFRVYRAALAEVEPPCIPYLGLILQDLTFVHLGNPDTVMTSQGSKVNFSKRWQQFNILYSLKSYQQTPYSLQPNDDIILFFNCFSDHLAEEALWELSLTLRPRNTPRANQR